MSVYVLEFIVHNLQNWKRLCIQRHESIYLLNESGDTTVQDAEVVGRKCPLVLVQSIDAQNSRS